LGFISINSSLKVAGAEQLNRAQQRNIAINSGDSNEGILPLENNKMQN